MTQLNDITFGIEFETTMPRGSVEVGSYHSGASVDWLPAGWQAKHDGSIRTVRGRVGCEFVSPVLKGVEGAREVVRVLDAIKARGAKVNASTGLHIHVGFPNDDKALERLTTLVSNFETAIYASTGTKSRERGSWCGSIRRHQDAARAVQVSGAHRYHVLNLTNLKSGRRPAVEFRAFAGTLNAVKVIGHLRMCLGLVERALTAKRTTNWVAKTPVETSPMHRSGVGQTELTRLFYQLGWTKGRTNYTYGNLASDFLLPPVKATKRELMRMARKYDAQA